MATIYISEFTSIGGAVPSANTQAAKQPCITDQAPIVTSGSSQQSAAFNAQTSLVRIHTDGIMSFAFGQNPTASTSSARMTSNQTEYFSVVAGQKVAVITNT